MSGRRQRIESFATVVFSLFLGVFVLFSVPAFALHRDLPFMLDVNPMPGTNHNGMPSIGEPHWIAFESSDDPLHAGIGGTQLFLTNSMAAIDRECTGNNPGPTFRQITRLPEGAANPATATAAFAVAFDSTADLLGSSTGRKIFVWRRQRHCFSDGPFADPSGGTIEQLTDGTMDCSRPTVDSKGEIFAWECQGVGGPEVWLYNTIAVAPTPKLVRVGQGQRPTLTHDGNVVVFDSNAALAADTPLPPTAVGFSQIYAYNRVLQRLFRLTSGSGESIHPTPAAKLAPGQIWPMVAFQSSADLLANGSTGWQIFLLDPDTADLRQITQPPGQSTDPDLGVGMLTFLSTGDLLGTGTPGQHTFFYDLRIGRMFDIAAEPGSLWAPPRAGGGNFLLVETTQDLLHEGGVGWREYVVNTWTMLPTPALGGKHFKLLEGDAATGSRLKATTQQWHTNVAVPPGGGLSIDFDSLTDLRAEVHGVVSNKDIIFPPVQLGGDLGAVCIDVLGDGDATYDCDGGPPGRDAPGGDVIMSADHFVNACGGPCARSVLARTVNDLAAGGMVIDLPVRVGLTQTLDGGRCPTDPTRYTWRVDTTLLLTTGTAAAEIENADGVADATLTAMETGSPFDCRRFQLSNFAGAELVGVMPVLQVPELPDSTAGAFSTQDLILSFRFEPYVNRDYHPCTGRFCGSLQPCRSDSECNDANVCNGADRCTTGLVDFTKKDICANKTDCIDRRCIAGDVVCDNGNVCDGVETCDPLVGCTLGTPPLCDDGAVCTEDICDPVRGCISASIPMCCHGDADCNNISACDGLETCLNGDCVAGTPVVCDDGDACNGVESCDPTTGSCLPGSPPLCDDGSICTDDSCDPVLGCVHIPNATVSCDDGDACTANDACDNGICRGTPVVFCDDGNACNGFEACDPATGTCLPGVVPDCDDGIACTTDSCDTTYGCLHADGCDDGDPCNGVEHCTDTGCVSDAPVICDDGDPCNGTETCSNVGGVAVCTPGTAPTCDDGNPCNGIEACVPSIGCQTVIPVNCDDGNACNGVETCDPVNGCVAGTAPNCDDGDPCTVDACDPLTGCLHDPMTGIDGALCQLNALTQELVTQPTDMTDAMYVRMRRRATNATKNLQNAIVAVPKVALHLERKTLSALTRIMRGIDRAHKRNQCSDPACDRVRIDAAEGAAAIQPLVTP